MVSTKLALLCLQRLRAVQASLGEATMDSVLAVLGIDGGMMPGNIKVASGQDVGLMACRRIAVALTTPRYAVDSSSTTSCLARAAPISIAWTLGVVQGMTLKVGQWGWFVEEKQSCFFSLFPLSLKNWWFS